MLKYEKGGNVYDNSAKKLLFFEFYINFSHISSYLYINFISLEVYEVLLTKREINVILV